MPERDPIHMRALNRVCQWRTIFTGWQLGTRPKGEPEADAVRHHREGSIILRVEVSALAQLLIKKGVFSIEEFEAQLAVEASNLDAMFAKQFPGITSSDNGMVIDIGLARETMKGWRP